MSKHSLDPAQVLSESDVQDILTDKEKAVERSVAEALNRHSMENGSNTPDFILAQFLLACLAAWNRGTQQRETWYGRDSRPGGSYPTPLPPPKAEQTHHVCGDGYCGDPCQGCDCGQFQCAPKAEQEEKRSPDLVSAIDRVATAPRREWWLSLAPGGCVMGHSKERYAREYAAILGDVGVVRVVPAEEAEAAWERGDKYLIEIESLRAARARLESHLRDCGDKLLRDGAELSALRDEVRQLRADNDAQKMDRARLEKERDEASERANDYQDKIMPGLREENARLLAERDEARALKVPATTEAVLQAEMAAAVARVERDEAKAQAEKTQQECDAHAREDEAVIAKLVTEGECAGREMGEVVRSAHEAADDYRKQLAALRKRVGELEAGLSDLVEVAKRLPQTAWYGIDHVALTRSIALLAAKET